MRSNHGKERRRVYETVLVLFGIVIDFVVAAGVAGFLLLVFTAIRDIIRLFRLWLFDREVYFCYHQFSCFLAWWQEIRFEFLLAFSFFLCIRLIQRVFEN